MRVGEDVESWALVLCWRGCEMVWLSWKQFGASPKSEAAHTTRQVHPQVASQKNVKPRPREISAHPCSQQHDAKSPTGRSDSHVHPQAGG